MRDPEASSRETVDQRLWSVKGVLPAVRKWDCLPRMKVDRRALDVGRMT